MSEKINDFFQLTIYTQTISYSLNKKKPTHSLGFIFYICNFDKLKTNI